MSGSESENDYESADDTEESSVTETNVAVQVHDKIGNMVESRIEHSSLAFAVPKQENYSPSEPQTAENTDLEILQFKSDESMEQGKEREIPEMSISETAVSAENINATKLEPLNVGQVIDSQPKRVTLRLEKKIHQKNQTINVESRKIGESKSVEKVPSSSSWGFSSWSASLFSTAAASVTTFTNQVSQGIEAVVETVESTLGAPPPEDLATALKEKREQEEAITILKQQISFEDEMGSVENEDVDAENKEESGGIGPFASSSSLLTGVTSLTKVIESTGTKVIMSGLDTLEMIGKKTMDILTEGDPGLRRRRSALSRGVNLSQVLREAKEKAEADQANMTAEDQEDSIHFTRFFDENQGLVHLEALEMLSNQCLQKVQGALMASGDYAVKELLEQICRICEDLPSPEDTPDDEIQDFDSAVGVHIKELQIPFNLEKIKKVQNSVVSFLASAEAYKQFDEICVKDIQEIYRQSISSLAEFTAGCVEQFHKFGELILVQAESDFDILMCATHLTGLTSVLCAEIGSIATQYCQRLNAVAIKLEDSTVSALITSTYLEASNSTSYIQDAFQLLVPVLQFVMLK